MKYGYRWTSGFGMVILVLFLSLIYFWAEPAKAQGSGRAGGWWFSWWDNNASIINYPVTHWDVWNVGTGGGYHNYLYSWMRWPGTDNGVSRTIWFRIGYDDSHQLNINGQLVAAGPCCQFSYGYFTAKPGEIVKLEYWSENYSGGVYSGQIAWDPQGDGTYELLDSNTVALNDPVSGGGSYWYSSSETIIQSQQKALDRAKVAALAQGNKLYIAQSGTNPTVDIIQEGTANYIQGRAGVGDALLIGNFNTVRIRQGDGLGSGRNLIEFDVNGDSNTITLQQGWNGTWPTVSKDGIESGGHFMDLKVAGSNNTITMKQANAGGVNSGHYNRTEVTGNTNTITVNQGYGANAYHSFFATITGNSNSVNVNQAAAGGQYMDLLLSGSGHTVNATQTGSGSHKATISLSNAGGSSTLNLTQQGAVAQQYNITQACANLSGCSVTVTQGSP